ncbi:MAG: hypothetical protein DHS20C08_09190 [Rhodomicrobium sp.]|nr:MAG: hypothetical protein DHS20C08_09190 [Rhodomicrobium sp.]
MALNMNFSEWYVPGAHLIGGSVIGVVLVTLALFALGGFCVWLWQWLRGSLAVAASPRSNHDRPYETRFDGVVRRIVIRGFEGDLHGHVGETVLSTLRRSLSGGLFGGVFSGRGEWAPFRLITGVVEGAEDRASHEGLPRSKATGKKSCDGGLSLSINGQVEGRCLRLSFFPQGPVVMETIAGADEHGAVISGYHYSEYDNGNGGGLVRGADRSVPDAGGNYGQKPEGSILLSYECFDFPIFQLNGLTRQLPALQSVILSVTVAGLVSRGAGIEGMSVPAKQLLAWGNRLSREVEGLRLTQPVLYQEAVVVTGWCFLVAGLLENDAVSLRRALGYYDIASAHNWRDRDVTEWAGIKANEAMAALSLAQLQGGSGLFQRVVGCALESTRHFRSDNFPASWGKMMCKLALSNGALTGSYFQTARPLEGDWFEPGPEGGALPQGDDAQLVHESCDLRDAEADDGRGDETEGSLALEAEDSQNALNKANSNGAASGGESALIKSAPGEGRLANVPDLQLGQDYITHDYRKIETSLDRAIEFWQRVGDSGAIAEAHFAKGTLAQNSARRHMGLQNWQRAENAFLAALASSRPRDFWATRRQADIRFELARLYLGWGTRFGDRDLLEKAIHHFSALNEPQMYLTAARRQRLSYYLAQATLNCGGITNDEEMHRAAIKQLHQLKKAPHDGGRFTEEVDRALAVGRARVALLKRDRGQAKKAVSHISAVIGQNNGHWPQRDVLLRLRARLREMLFQLEGDNMALDRAINDRRELVVIASEGLRDLRWSVEVGNLVGLLSKRQYKLDGEAEDFHEAHYLLEKAIAICSSDQDDGDGAPVRYPIPHIEAGLHLKLGQLLATFARVQFDLSALNEAVGAFERYLSLTPRSSTPLSRAEVLNDIGQIMMDRSEHYGQHDGLWRALRCFAEAHDIYLEAEQMDQANRMRRFLENAEAAILAYQVPMEGGDGDVLLPGS